MENNNSVAFISRINDISPINGADKIELVTVEGWKSTTQKGIHKVGDLVLTITTDAVIPEDLAIKWGVINYLRKGNRVRTIKLKGVYSECILIPLSGFLGQPKLAKEGSDMMDLLTITKYEPPVQVIHVNGRKHEYRNNPNFHVYYKFPNQKNTPNMFNEKDEVIITRKIHGTNARYGIVKKTRLSVLDKIRKFFGNKWIEYEYIYGSHNVEKGSDSQGFYSTDVWKEIADKYTIKDQLWDIVKNYIDKDSLGTGIVVYGEIYGLGIQGEKYSYNLKSKEFAGFDIKINGEYLNETFENVYFKHLKLPQVPLLYCGNWSREIQERYLYDNIDGTNIPHEGLVVKHISGDRQKISKCINPNYLIFSEKNNISDSH